MKECPNCKENFKPKIGKQKFCSDKCKVAFARKTAKALGLKSGKTMLDEIREDNKKVEWVKEVEDFCNKNGCTHKELIEAYKTWTNRMAATAQAIREQKVTITTTSNKGSIDYIQARRNQKLGIK